MTLRFLITATLALLAGFASSVAASTITIDTFGRITGAAGVEVDGTLYDVVFIDASCIAIFTGCDSPTDFDFTTETAANAASQALLDQVLLDGPSGSFDSDPGLTFGCISTEFCWVWTPYFIFGPDPGGFIQASLAFNLPAGDVSGTGNVSAFTNFAELSWTVYADWTPAADHPVVPEPASFALIAVGLAGLGVRRWRRRKAQ